MDSLVIALTTQFFLLSLLRQLTEFWKRLTSECQWLRSVRLNLCVRCELCKTSGSTPCGRHAKQECSHDDCAHYLDLKKSLDCEYHDQEWPPESFNEECRPWIEVSLKALAKHRQKSIISIFNKEPGRVKANLCLRTPLCYEQFTWSQRDQNSYMYSFYLYNMNTSILWTLNSGPLIRGSTLFRYSCFS